MKIFPRRKKSGSSAPLRRGMGTTRLERTKSSGGGGSCRHYSFVDDASRRLISPVPLVESDVSDTASSNASPPVTPLSSRKVARSRSLSYNMNSHVEAYPPSRTASPRIARTPLRTMSFSYTPKKKRGTLQHIVGRMRSFKDNKSVSSRSGPYTSVPISENRSIQSEHSITSREEIPAGERNEVLKSRRGGRGHSPERYAVEQDASTFMSTLTDSVYSNSFHGNTTPVAELAIQPQVPPPVLLNAPSDEDSVFDDMSYYTDSTGFTGGTSAEGGTVTTGCTTSVAGETVDTNSASGFDSVYSTGASGDTESFRTMKTILEDISHQKSRHSRRQKEDSLSLLGSIASDAEAFMSDVAAVGMACGACANDDFSFDGYSTEEDEEAECRRRRRKAKSKKSHHRK